MWRGDELLLGRGRLQATRTPAGKDRGARMLRGYVDWGGLRRKAETRAASAHCAEVCDGAVDVVELLKAPRKAKVSGARRWEEAFAAAELRARSGEARVPQPVVAWSWGRGVAVLWGARSACSTSLPDDTPRPSRGRGAARGKGR